jgi:hypothetical protein
MSAVASNAAFSSLQPSTEALSTSGWAGVWASGTSLLNTAQWVDPRPMAAMTLCLEVTLPPIGRRKAVRLWQGAAPPEAAVALYAVAEGRLRLIHGDVDTVTPSDFVRVGETVSLRYRACARGRSDVVDLMNHDRMLDFRVRAGVAHAARLDEALPRDPRFLSVCHVAAVAGFGLRAADLPAIAAGTLLMTEAGPRPVEQLAAGDLLTTVTGERLPLRWVERRPRLCLGRSAPVRLRAPYFGLEHDLFLSPETRIMRDGPAVEYLFGEERVLVRAGDLLASPGALRDSRLPVRDFFHLMLDDHACIAVDRCGVETALLSDVLAADDGAGGHSIAPMDRTPCLPVLDRSAAQALVAASMKGNRGPR